MQRQRSNLECTYVYLPDNDLFLTTINEEQFFSSQETFSRKKDTFKMFPCYLLGIQS